MERISQFVLTIQHSNAYDITDEELRIELTEALENGLIHDNEYLQITQLGLQEY